MFPRAGETYLPSQVNGSGFKQVIGWNRYCKPLYQDAREKFLIWIENGRLRDGQLFANMKDTRSRFRNALKYCRNNEVRIRKEIFIENYYSNNKGDFWQQCRKHTSKTSSSKTINGKSDMGDILKIFKGKFTEIFDDPSSNLGGKGRVNEGCRNDDVFMFYFLKPFIDKNIMKIKDGLGWDGIHSNHIKFLNRTTRNFIGKLFASMLRHSHVPKEMIRGHINPTLKINKVCKN